MVAFGSLSTARVVDDRPRKGKRSAIDHEYLDEFGGEGRCFLFSKLSMKPLWLLKMLLHKNILPLNIKKKLAAASVDATKLFDGKLGRCKDEEVQLELDPNDESVHSKPHPVLKTLASVFLRELWYLCARLEFCSGINRRSRRHSHSSFPRKTDEYNGIRIYGN